MAQAARTYSSYMNTAPQRAPRTDTRPDIEVLPGGSHEDPALKCLSSQAITAFKCGIALVMLVALVFGVRAVITAATVATLDENAQLTEQLAQAQETGTQLEVQHSILTDPQRVTQQAEALGMVISDDVTYVTVDYDAGYVVNDDGSISLAKTLAHIETQAAAAAAE